MLDIISMITFLFLFIGLPMMLIIIGGSQNKTQKEIEDEEEAEMKYIKEYQEKKLEKKNKRKKILEVIFMKRELYTWKQVEAYSIIALHNLLHSANEVNLKNIKMCIEPLRTLHEKNEVVEYSEQLINNENK